LPERSRIRIYLVSEVVVWAAILPASSILKTGPESARQLANMRSTAASGEDASAIVATGEALPPPPPQPVTNKVMQNKSTTANENRCAIFPPVQG